MDPSMSVPPYTPLVHATLLTMVEALNAGPNASVQIWSYSDTGMRLPKICAEPPSVLWKYANSAHVWYVHDRMPAFGDATDVFSMPGHKKPATALS